jgi:hypothetical protein
MLSFQTFFFWIQIDKFLLFFIQNMLLQCMGEGDDVTQWWSPNKVIHKVTLCFTPYPLFQWYLQK